MSANHDSNNHLYESKRDYFSLGLQKVLLIGTLIAYIILVKDYEAGNLSAFILIFSSLVAALVWLMMNFTPPLGLKAMSCARSIMLCASSIMIYSFLETKAPDAICGVSYGLFMIIIVFYIIQYLRIKMPRRQTQIEDHFVD